MLRPALSGAFILLRLRDLFFYRQVNRQPMKNNGYFCVSVSASFCGFESSSRSKASGGFEQRHQPLSGKKKTLSVSNFSDGEFGGRKTVPRFMN